LGEDNFDRADENPVSGKWTEISGDWRVNANTLEAATPGVLVTSIRQPGPTRGGAGYAHQVTVTIVSTGGFTEWHLICNFVDANNFYWIKVYLDSGKYWPAFYIRSGGSDTLVMDKTTHPIYSGWDLESGILRLRICMADVEWCIQPTGAQGDLVWQTCVGDVVHSLPSDPTRGLVGYKQGRFDDFRYEIHWEARLDCAYCNCICFNGNDDVRCVAENLVVTMTPASGPYSWGFGQCSDPAAITFNMYQQAPAVAAYPTLPTFGAAYKTPRKFVWYSELIRGEGGAYAIHGGVNWLLLVCDLFYSRIYLAVLEYPNADLTHFTARASAGSPYWSAVDDPSCGSAKYFDLTDSTCNPFSLVFKGLVFPRSAVGQCDIYGTSYDVVITE
jgi:hypothetical protein